MGIANSYRRIPEKYFMTNINSQLQIISEGIRNCSFENTYKVSWIRAIIECLLEGKNREKEIALEDIAVNMFKHYWNQTIFFDLEQGQNINKKPLIVQLVKEQIEFYQNRYNNFKPEYFAKVQNKISIDTKRIVQIIKRDVSWRFQKDLDLYSLNLKENNLILHNPTLLISNSDLLLELISYRWTQILETFNSSPKIANKVKGTDKENIKRKSLTQFHKYLDLENPDRVCFLTNAKIEEGELSVHHVIPWSYLYSDDLWNLVYSKKTANSKQSNKLPSKELILKLEKRNSDLLNCMKTNLTRHKQTAELERAIQSDYVQKFWIGCKG